MMIGRDSKDHYVMMCAIDSNLGYMDSSIFPKYSCSMDMIGIWVWDMYLTSVPNSDT